MSILFGFLPLLVICGVIYGVVSAVRSTRPTEPFDAAEAFKSVAIHFGLFLAFVGISIGTIDLLQFVVAGDQLAGTNSDLARAMSILIVSLPAFGLLLKTIRGRYASRGAGGDSEAHRGWSLYLIAALTTALVGVLVSVVQITDDLASDFRGIEAEEVMQLCGWFAMWAAHWFVLRPRFGVRGDLHLAIGSVLGLAWLIAGIAAVINRVLSSGYDAAFDNSLAGSYDIVRWLIIGVVGAAVWAFHWFAHFTTAGPVEGDRRRSPLWYATVVLAGILPGLIIMLISGTAMVAGVLIWFFGTTDSSASEFFEPGPGLLTMLFVGFVVWAYHRWELDRDGTVARNEVLRLNDYVVVAVGLIAVVAAIATLFSLVFDVLLVGPGIAGNLDVGNVLIVILVVLAASSSVWWRVWDRIEQWRQLQPFEESDSVWRKMYLVAAFGLGGLVLAVSLIWLLFAFLRDLLDGELGVETLNDLSSPIGWSIAVIGAVWYHLGVWRADRTTLDAFAPATAPSTMPPAPKPEDRVSEDRAPEDRVSEDRVSENGASSLTPGGSSAARTAAAEASTTDVRLRSVIHADHGELYSLQRAAFVDEAIAYGTPDVPALNESFEDFQLRLADSATVVAIEGSRLVGSVCLNRRAGGGVRIERLMVAPDRRRMGIATQLLDELEGTLARQGEQSVQLVVGEIVPAARSLYVDRDYTLVSRDQAEGGPVQLTMKKLLGNTNPSDL